MTTFGTLFSGGGGVDVGLMAAGLSPLWAVEYDADIAGIYRQNIGEHVIVADVRNVDYAALAPVDWLHASPVCTNASVANPNGKESETDIATARAVVRAIQAQQPQVFTLENVWGYRDYASFRLILNTLGDAGYFYDFEHVNAADMAVPQTRRRLILRASRGLLPALPQPVPWVGWYAAIEDLIPTLPESQLAPWQLARLPEELRTLLISEISHSVVSRPSHMQAVFVKGDDYSGEDGIVTRAADLPAPTFRSGRSAAHRAVLVSKTADKFGDGHRHESEPAQTIGANEHGSKALLLTNGQYDGRLVAAGEGDPAHTITGNTNQTRLRAMLGFRVVAMTPRCLARFQSFPDAYVLPEKRTLAARVIGNAVPPLLMQKIAEGLLDAL